MTTKALEEEEEVGINHIGENKQNCDTHATEVIRTSKEFKANKDASLLNVIPNEKNDGIDQVDESKMIEAFKFFEF